MVLVYITCTFNYVFIDVYTLCALALCKYTMYKLHILVWKVYYYCYGFLCLSAFPIIILVEVFAFIVIFCCNVCFPLHVFIYYTIWVTGHRSVELYGKVHWMYKTSGGQTILLLCDFGQYNKDQYSFSYFEHSSL